MIVGVPVLARRAGLIAGFSVLALAIAGPSAVAATPVANYAFNGNLNPASGSVPPLTVVNPGSVTGSGFVSEDVGGCPTTAYHFAAGTGLAFLGFNPPQPDNYTVSFQLRLDQVSGYRRLLGADAPDPFSSPSSENGIYVRDGRLGVFRDGDAFFGGPPIAPGSLNEVAVSQGSNSPDFPVSVYLNGNLTASTALGNPIAIYPANTVTLFKDDGVEEASGTISSLQFFNTTLQPSELPQPLPQATCPPAQPPQTSGPRKCKKKHHRRALAAKKKKRCKRHKRR
jgi:Concanavalin A-like lectin/glucanases superfamily